MTRVSFCIVILVLFYNMEIMRDEFGPEYVLRVTDAKLGMEGFLVIDNTALGPGKGGMRMTPDVSAHEVFRLARTMTWKNAMAGIPFGGAKSGVVWKGGSDELKKQFIQSFARALKPLIPKKYIGGPDLNTGEREMQWFAEAHGNWRSVTGKPANYCMEAMGKKGEKCGIPHEFGSTGFGVSRATSVAAELLGMDLRRARVAIEGFGNVGSFAFKHLHELGATIVAVADKDGTAYNEHGLDEEVLTRLKASGKSVGQYPNAQQLRHDDIFTLPVDILIPAAVTDVINEKNKDKIQARLIIEGANIPMTEAVERALYDRGIFVIPDFIANAGGVISSYAEYRGYNPKRMFELVERKITDTVREVVSASLKTKKFPRAVAMEIAQEKVRTKTKTRVTTF